MANVYKYLTLIENLKFSTKYDEREKLAKENWEFLRKYVDIPLEKLEDELRLDEPACRLNVASYNDWTYSCLLLHVLQTIKNNMNLDNEAKEELISVRQIANITGAVQSVSYFGIVKYLDKSYHNYPPFRIHEATQHSNRCVNLKCSVSLIFELIYGTHLLLQQDIVIMQLMAALFTICDTAIAEPYERMLTYLWDHVPKEEYFKSLLFLKGIRSPAGTQKLLHNELLRRLTEPGGYSALIKNIIAGGGDGNVPKWKRFQVTSRIIAHKGHSKTFHVNMIDQIFQFIKTNFVINSDLQFMEASVATLQEIGKLNDEFMNIIEKEIDADFGSFINPKDLLTGCIVMDNIQFSIFTSLQFNYFCASTYARFSSKMLVKYVPMLLTMSTQMVGPSVQNSHINNLIIHCLANREKKELCSILETVVLKKTNVGMLDLHPRVFLKYCGKENSYQVVIVSEEEVVKHDVSMTLAKILKDSNHNILMYNVFITLLELFERESSANPEEWKNDLVVEDDVEDMVEYKFEKRMCLISCLAELITHRPLYVQLRENSSEVFRFLEKMIKKRIDNSANASDNDECLSMCLAVFQEILEMNENIVNSTNLKKSLKSYLNYTKNETIQRQISTLLDLLDGRRPRIELDHSKYQNARSLLSETQPHLIVYGLSQMRSLIDEGDKETLANKYSILASALIVLRNGESFVFHNCIRLLVKLAGVLEAVVLESLGAEYLNESENIDYRLKVGDAILQVNEGLGAVLYKYKNNMVNCFMHGCKSDNNELRTSSFSNLGVVCKQLQYEIHNFFYELISLVEFNVQMEEYLPAKRASILVLSQLLQGIDNLLQFQEYLLPIYRLLKSVIENDTDEICRVHATNGLKALTEKCKEFLTPKLDLQKEIKITGINDNDVKKKGHILELN